MCLKVKLGQTVLPDMYRTKCPKDLSETYFGDIYEIFFETLCLTFLETFFNTLYEAF